MKKNHIKFFTFITLLALISLFTLAGCNQEPIERRQQAPIYNWDSTDDGNVNYRWTSDGSCVIRSFGQQHYTPRNIYKGRHGSLSWKWENDGDLDIVINNRSYDLDSPYDMDTDENDIGFGAVGSGTAGIGAGALLLNKKHNKKVVGYDASGNPIDKHGKVLPKYDKKGILIKYKKPALTTFSVRKASDNTKALEQKIAKQSKELKRQQAANARKNKLLKQQTKTSNYSNKSKTTKKK